MAGEEINEIILPEEIEDHSGSCRSPLLVLSLVFLCLSLSNFFAYRSSSKKAFILRRGNEKLLPSQRVSFSFHLLNTQSEYSCFQNRGVYFICFQNKTLYDFWAALIMKI